MLRFFALLAIVDCVATASIWWYLVQSKISDVFLYAVAGVWVFALCALVGLLIYVSTELNGQLLPVAELRKH